MSYIDCFDHEYIGQIGYLPIYHPTEIIKGENYSNEDFSATPDNLVIGGGSGEHPAIVLKNIECMVARYLYHFLDDESCKKLSEEEEKYIEGLYFSKENYEILEFCGWSTRNYVGLEKLFNSEFINKYKEDHYAEDWLIRNVGELVYFSLPELNPENDKLHDIFDRFSIGAKYGNILCTPAGYPPCGGRYMKNGRAFFGKHRL